MFSFDKLGQNFKYKKKYPSSFSLRKLTANVLSAQTRISTGQFIHMPDKRLAHYFAK